MCVCVCVFFLNVTRMTLFLPLPWEQPVITMRVFLPSASEFI